MTTEERPALLQAHDIQVRFGGVVAVAGVSLTLRGGAVHGLIGPNGAGKSTFIDAVTGFVRPGSGRVLLGDRDITGLPAHRRVRAGLTRSFQNLELFEDLTVRENLVAAALSSRRSSAGAVTAFADELGLTDELDEHVHDLAHGRRRLVSVGRCMSAKPSVLVLDEPGSGLSGAEKATLTAVLRRYAATGACVLLVDHDMGFVMSCCDRLTVLDFGKVLAEGHPDRIRVDQAVQAAYLGERESQ